ncbi:MxaS protein [Bradyrhizobium ontarionense]|uniref:MxaS protein n=1 Tax=Bradyrhizobium ontarionense TaxID=2898149 RepID=A0ABY3R781_9BRAD|nr:MxaS protein [Bradyrhizobium sp. A19]UFZ02681.1 MxaS protein [Bradyrhizobium sp. A19]
MTESRDIVYRPRGRISGLRAGAHASRGIGTFGTFRDQVPFMAHPDARRIDVRGTLRDPFEATLVRRFQQRNAIDVYALVDMTRSLSYEGRARKQDLVAELCGALARSVIRSGDRFALIGFDSDIRPDCFIPPNRRLGSAVDVEALLRQAEWRGRDAKGLHDAARRLGGRRKIVFVVSDFLLPLDLLEAGCEALSQHDLIPVVIDDSSERSDLPDWGLLELTDLETLQRKVVFMRPALKRRWLAQEAERRAGIRRILLRFGRAPVLITDVIDVDLISRQLMEA